MEAEEITRRAEFAVEIALGPTKLSDGVRAILVREIETEIKRAYQDGQIDGSKR